jgi:hypothetical protein
MTIQLSDHLIIINIKMKTLIEVLQGLVFISFLFMLILFV